MQRHKYSLTNIRYRSNTIVLDSLILKQSLKTILQYFHYSSLEYHCLGLGLEFNVSVYG